MSDVKQRSAKGKKPDLKQKPTKGKKPETTQKPERGKQPEVIQRPSKFKLPTKSGQSSAPSTPTEKTKPSQTSEPTTPTRKNKPRDIPATNTPTEKAKPKTPPNCTSPTHKVQPEETAPAGEHSGTSNMSAEEVREARERLSELETKLQALGEEEEEKMDKIRRLANTQMKEKMQRLQEQVQLNLDTQLSNVGSRYEEHALSMVVGKQTDVLRTNKVIREVSRALGADWRPVFERLTCVLPQDAVSDATKKVESARSFMQSYTALQCWRDLAGDKFDISRLPMALKECGHHDLGDSAARILNSGGDALFSVSRGQLPSSVRPNVDDVTNGISDAAPVAPAPRTKAEQENHLEGLLGDRKLLKLARLIGGEWLPLGNALGVPEEDLNEISESEGSTYQGAFKVLWAWRDNLENRSTDSVSQLAEALEKCRKTEAADELQN